MKKMQWMAALLSAVLLFATGCTPSDEPPERFAAETMTQTTETTERTVDGTASLVSLRQAMVETPQLFAVAYFGYHDIQDPYEILAENAPGLCADLPFLPEIPQDRIIGESGDLFCIVPLDESATVAVSKGVWDPRSEQYLYEKSVYFSKTGDPILLFCNDTGFEPDTQLYISGDSGEVIWYPQTDDNLCAMPLRDENWDTLFWDFSPYRELLLKNHRDMQGEWVMPTAEMLTGTTWVWEGCSKGGVETGCRMTFGEDTLSVRWNDGMEEDHVYPDARWELTCEENFAVLSIDFREMAGILRYNLLYHEEYEVLYVAMDALQEELPVGWEPLYRYLTPPEPPEPVEMLGSWELAWTEVEGDRNEAESGACTIEIRMGASSGFLMSYMSREFPHEDFHDELLTFDNRAMYLGCGNDAWVADLDYVGPWDTTCTVTLTAEDILIKQNHFLIDGAPAVSYEFFRRAAG